MNVNMSNTGEEFTGFNNYQKFQVWRLYSRI